MSLREMSRKYLQESMFLERIVHPMDKDNLFIQFELPEPFEEPEELPELF